ncbi:hypothetical protein L1049_015696 [Liquidambar formosana]|uniref:Pseudouridine synthase RsuA/RluA-like domain-containing protein n=1 Tax=Liquidambar formosana TaxID=63359 RepID=A0AAP0RYB1_LIQFO
MLSLDQFCSYIYCFISETSIIVNWGDNRNYASVIPCAPAIAAFTGRCITCTTTWKAAICQSMFLASRNYSRISPPPSACGEPVIRVSNNMAKLGSSKESPKPRQLLSLPPFPPHPLAGKNTVTYVTTISWIKYYFDEIPGSVIQSHFNKGLLSHGGEVMEAGARVYVPVSVAETRISRGFDTIPSGTLYPNADEIEYLQRLVIYKAYTRQDSAILLLNKPPKLPVKGNLPVHNSMDALAAAALSYNYDEGPNLVHRLDRESSGLLLMGRTQESIAHLQWLFSDTNKARFSSKAWNDACEATYQRHWALVIGSPKEKEGIICAPLSKVILDDGKTERVILASHSGLEPSQQAITEYRTQKLLSSSSDMDNVIDTMKLFLELSH